MNDFTKDFFPGFWIGLIAGSLLSFFLWVHNLDETMSYNELHRDIDKNLTIKQSAFKKFPNQYKLNYADWENLSKI